MDHLFAHFEKEDDADSKRKREEEQREPSKRPRGQYINNNDSNKDNVSAYC